jgi:hypothetical protein
MPTGNGVAYIAKNLVLGLLVHFEKFINQTFRDNFIMRLNENGGSIFIPQNSWLTIISAHIR